ncbi:MAG: hypothetical protein ABEJ42_06575 [Halobacteriaceae archaeon]
MVDWLFFGAGVVFVLLGLLRLRIPAQFSALRGGVVREYEAGGYAKQIGKGSLTHVVLLVGLGVVFLVLSVS